MPHALPALLLCCAAVACLWWAWRRPAVDWRLRTTGALLAVAGLILYMHGHGADRGAAIGVLVLIGCGLLALLAQTAATPARSTGAARPARIRAAVEAPRGSRWRALAGALLIGLGGGLAALYLSALMHWALQRAGSDAALNLVLAMSLFPLGWSLCAVLLAWLPRLRDRCLLLGGLLVPAALVLHGG